MSTLPWGTMNDWQRLEVEERATRLQRRQDARATREARRTQATPIVRTVRAASQPVSRADCTEAA